MDLFLIAGMVSCYAYLRSRRKKNRVVNGRGLEGELQEYLRGSDDPISKAADIKGYLIRVIHDKRVGAEKFSDEQLAEAQRILDRAGPGAFYWMADIASELAILSAAQANGIPTNVGEELGSGGVTPEAIVGAVVRY